MAMNAINHGRQALTTRTIMRVRIYKEQRIGGIIGLLMGEANTMFGEHCPQRNGIIYFTTRDENLDSSKDNDKNIALFPKFSENIFYDQELIDKFIWGNITTL